MESWIIITVTIVILLVAVLVTVLLTKKDTFPTNQNIIIKNTFTSTYNTVLCVETNGNIYYKGNLHPNNTTIIRPVNDTLLVIADTSNNDMICTIFAKLDNNIKLFEISNLNTSLFNFTPTTLVNTTVYINSLYTYVGSINTTPMSDTINDGDTFPNSISLYNKTSTELDVLAYKSNGAVIKAETVNSSEYTSNVSISINPNDYILIIGSYSAEQIYITGMVIYNQNGKIRLINIGQPEPLLLLCTEQVNNQISRQARNIPTHTSILEKIISHKLKF
jgi:hypothetical protein